MMINEAFAMAVFQRAMIAAILASIACGVVGSFVVVRRMSSISGGLSHAAFGGVGLGYLLGIGPLTGALIFSVLCAATLAYIYRREREHLDTIISMLWSLGMAVGMIALALFSAGAPDLTHYLFGSILFVPSDYLWALLAVDAAILACLFVGRRAFLAISFDEEFSEIRGLPVGAFLLFLFVVVAVAVVMLMKVAGVILTIALLTTPAVIARQWAKSLPWMMTLASFAASFMCIGGLLFTYALSDRWAVDVPTGPAIIVLGTLLYLLSTIVQHIRGSERLR